MILDSAQGKSTEYSGIHFQGLLFMFRCSALADALLSQAHKIFEGYIEVDYVIALDLQRVLSRNCKLAQLSHSNPMSNCIHWSNRLILCFISQTGVSHRGKVSLIHVEILFILSDFSLHLVIQVFVWYLESPNNFSYLHYRLVWPLKLRRQYCTQHS